MNNLKSSLKIFFLVFALSAFSRTASATPVVQTAFERDTIYDIYFEAGHNDKFIIRGVEIVGFQDIGGKNFLVIKAGGFNLKQDEGFILFDSVSAVLPNWQFKVERLPSKYIHSK